MTDHNTLQMQHADRRLEGREFLEPVLSMSEYCTVALHDDPYPYIVPMNMGYEWDETGLRLYLHMAAKGHRIDLIKRDPHVCVNVCTFLDRCGYRQYRNEGHDYRSITVFGTARILEPKDEEEFLHGLNVLAVQHGRAPVKKVVPDFERRLRILEVTAEQITGKAQYPISDTKDLPIPPNMEK